MSSSADQTLELLFLICASLFPAVFLIARAWMLDKHEPEPITVVASVVIVGLVLPLIAYWPEMLMSRLIAALHLSTTATGLLDAFFVAGLIEELAKLALFMAMIWPNANFNEPFDGMIYAVAIAMGFAGLENILYVMIRWFGDDAASAWAVVQARSLLAVPQHAICGMFMGYFLGLAKFTTHRKTRLQMLALALVVPFLLHGIYDAILVLFRERGTLLCLVLLAVQYWIARNLATRLVALSPFIPTGKSRLYARVGRTRPTVFTTRYRWPWQR